MLLLLPLLLLPCLTCLLLFLRDLAAVGTAATTAGMPPPLTPALQGMLVHLLLSI